ncbi:MAG: immune inhibitor A, partial [Bacteroidales bacterium]
KWAETLDGYSLLRNQDGIYTYAITDENGNMVPSNILAKDISNRSLQEVQFLKSIPLYLRFSPAQIENLQERIKQGKAPCPVSWNSFHSSDNQILYPAIPSPAAPTPKALLNDTAYHSIPILLVQFKDRTCHFGKNDFAHILNQPNYTQNGATGSVLDYFLDNSRGLFKFVSDIYGPYTLSQNMSFYGENDPYGNDKNPEEMVREAVEAAHKDGCDFSKYDANGDGYVDGVHILFAGEGEESTNEEDAIWSHEWNLRVPVTLDGKKVCVYSCSPELNMPGAISTIGVIIHELS